MPPELCSPFLSHASPVEAPGLLRLPCAPGAVGREPRQAQEEKQATDQSKQGKDRPHRALSRLQLPGQLDGDATRKLQKERGTEDEKATAMAAPLCSDGNPVRSAAVAVVGKGGAAMARPGSPPPLWPRRTASPAASTREGRPPPVRLGGKRFAFF